MTPRTWVFSVQVTRFQYKNFGANIDEFISGSGIAGNIACDIPVDVSLELFNVFNADNCIFFVQDLNSPCRILSNVRALKLGAPARTAAFRSLYLYHVLFASSKIVSSYYLVYAVLRHSLSSSCVGPCQASQRGRAP
jgi:hypothetical protein